MGSRRTDGPPARTCRWTLRLVPLAVLSALLAGSAGAQTEPLDRLDVLLASYVTTEGVRYDAWRADDDATRALRDVMADLRATDPSTLPPAERNALYINLYNARILEIVLTENPADSIRDVTWTWFGYGVFFRKDLFFDGKEISLHLLEKRIRRETGDPRIHFALNCASRSCPPLAAETYRGPLLDEQLDRATRAFLALPGSLEFDESGDGGDKVRLRVSKIFKWFDEDFTPSGGVVAFIRSHAPPEAARRLADNSTRIKLAYQDYDWSLNRAP